MDGICLSSATLSYTVSTVIDDCHDDLILLWFFKKPSKEKRVIIPNIAKIIFFVLTNCPYHACDCHLAKL